MSHIPRNVQFHIRLRNTRRKVHQLDTNECTIGASEIFDGEFLATEVDMAGKGALLVLSVCVIATG